MDRDESKQRSEVNPSIDPGEAVILSGELCVWPGSQYVPPLLTATGATRLCALYITASFSIVFALT